MFRNKGNLNNHIGLPLSLLELRQRPEVAVVELGMNHPGEIRTLVGIAEPDVRVWTNVGDAHLGFFESPDAIADAKAEILEHAARRGRARRQRQRPADHGARRRVRRPRRHVRHRHAGGRRRRRDVEARGLDGTAADVRTPAGDGALRTPLLGLGNLANVLAATAVALRARRAARRRSCERAAALRPAAHRGELLRLPGGVTLVDDSYNSSPAALTRALETIGAATGSARKAAVLGEMLELGAHADAAARRVRARGRRARASTCWSRSAARPRAGDGRRRRSRAGMPAAAVRHVRHERRSGGASRSRRIRPGRSACSSRARAASAPTWWSIG